VRLASWETEAGAGEEEFEKRRLRKKEKEFLCYFSFFWGRDIGGLLISVGDC
jgi:hypothetical protein